jgi:hypothetical protein
MRRLQNETYHGYTEFNEEEEADMRIINGEFKTEREILTARITKLETRLASAEKRAEKRAEKWAEERAAEAQRGKLEGARKQKSMGVAPEAISAGLGLSLQEISAL